MVRIIERQQREREKLEREKLAAAAGNHVAKNQTLIDSFFAPKKRKIDVPEKSENKIESNVNTNNLITSSEGAQGPTTSHVSIIQTRIK